MMRISSMLLALSLGFFFVQCDSGNSSDGKSSWLRGCSTDADCGAPFTCQCGVCTTGCTGTDECQGLPGAAACIDVSSAERGGRCRLGAGTNAGLCVAACRVSADCNAQGVLECVAGVCMPVRARDAKDGGATAPDTDSGTRASGGSPATGGAGNGASAGGGSLDTSSAGTGAGRDASVRPTISVSPSDAPPNAYGGPGDAATPLDQLCGGLSPFAYSRTDAPCLVFASCAPACTNDTDCPPGGSGNAVPTCNQRGGPNWCSLSCENGERCPTGMICDVDPDVADPKPVPQCVWVVDSTDKGCPGYCKLDPIPRECPNWCAAIGVACDPTKNVNCCAGLSCGSEHFCVER